MTDNTNINEMFFSSFSKPVYSFSLVGSLVEFSNAYEEIDVYTPGINPYFLICFNENEHTQSDTSLLVGGGSEGMIFKVRCKNTMNHIAQCLPFSSTCQHPSTPFVLFDITKMINPVDIDIPIMASRVSIVQAKHEKYDAVYIWFQHGFTIAMLPGAMGELVTLFNDHAEIAYTNALRAESSGLCIIYKRDYPANHNIKQMFLKQNNWYNS